MKTAIELLNDKIEAYNNKGNVLPIPEMYKVRFADCEKEFIKQVMEEYAQQMLETEKERLSQLYNDLPDDCIQGWDEVKFCSHRNGEGGRCRQCV